jgi:cell division protein FtsW (lipid II flippase)
MVMTPRLVPLLAPIPAFLGSLLLIQFAQAGSLVLIQQILFFLASAAVCAFAVFRQPVQPRTDWRLLTAAALAGLIAPLFLTASDGPQRWLELGGFRLYVAALVLPMVVWILTHATRFQPRNALWVLPSSVLIGATLALQPDAAQATAFSMACLVLVFVAPVQPVGKLTTAALLATCATVAWLQPDPLQPISYVEGVLTLALSVSPLALILALCALITPIAVMTLRAKAAPAFYAVVVYYLTIGICACFGLTPMPLLGFGAAPIFGYFLLIYISSRADNST